MKTHTFRKLTKTNTYNENDPLLFISQHIMSSEIIVNGNLKVTVQRENDFICIARKINDGTLENGFLVLEDHRFEIDAENIKYVDVYKFI